MASAENVLDTTINFTLQPIVKYIELEHLQLGIGQKLPLVTRVLAPKSSGGKITATGLLGKIAKWVSFVLLPLPSLHPCFTLPAPSVPTLPCVCLKKALQTTHGPQVLWVETCHAKKDQLKS